MSITLTFEQAEAALVAAAAAAPERSLTDMGSVCTYFFTGEAAVYANDRNARAGRPERYAPGQACCIVGQVLENAGMTLDDVGSLNEGTTVNGLAQEGLLRADPRALDLLSQAQQAQDSGKPWAEAVRQAQAIVAHTVEV